MRSRNTLILLTLTPFFLLFALLAQQIVVYFLSSPDRAASEAKIQFERECARNKLPLTDFDGPKLGHEIQYGYDFQWVNKSRGDVIWVLVSYLPFNTESWYHPSAVPPASDSLFPTP